MSANNRRIDEIRKKSAHELAVLLDETMNAALGECPVCVGCKKAKANKWDCIKAREEYLKGKITDGLLHL